MKLIEEDLFQIRKKIWNEITNKAWIKTCKKVECSVLIKVDSNIWEKVYYNQVFSRTHEI
jgi:hypothetical protein